MQKEEIEPGKKYAVREPVAQGVDLQQVKVLEHVRGTRWKVEWIDPNPGLVDYVTSKNLVCRWSDRRAFLREERDEQAMADAVERSSFPGEGHPLEQAVSFVLDSAGERPFDLFRGVLQFAEPEALERVAQRAGIAPPTHPSAYVDRRGMHYLPWDCALELAEAFARAEPRTVLDVVEEDERAWTARANEPFSHGYGRILSEYRAAWAIIRQWAGHDAAIAAREEQIDELRKLLTKTMWELRAPNPNVDTIANRIDRALRFSWG